MGAKTAGTGSPWLGFSADLPIDLQIRIGQLRLADTVVRDILADLKSTGGVLELRALKLAGPHGLLIEADGRLSDFDKRPAGAVNLLVAAEQPAALSALARFLELPEGSALMRRAPRLAPLRLGAILSLDGRGAGGVNLVIDGAAKDTRVSLNGRLEGPLVQWRAGRIDLTAVLEHADGAQLIAQLLPEPAGETRPVAAADGTAKDGAVRDGPGRGRLTVRTNGVPNSGLAAAIELETKSIDAGFSGQIDMATENIGTDGVSIAGEVGVKAADLSGIMRLVGLTAMPAIANQELVLLARLTAKTQSDIVAPDQPAAATAPSSRSVAFDITEASARIGNTAVEATGRITSRDQGLTMDLSAKTADASLPRLLAGFLGPRKALMSVPGTASQLPGEAETRGGPWPDDPILVSAFGPLTGKIQLEAARLALGDGLALQRAVVTAELTPAALALTSITGTALGGRFDAHMRAEKAIAGISVRGALKLQDAMLGEIGQPSRSVASAPSNQPPLTLAGTATLSLEFSGKGLTPRGLSTVLAGSGTLELGEIELSRLGPGAIETAVSAALAPKSTASQTPSGKPSDDGKIDPALVRALIAAELKQTPLKIAARRVSFEIIDGALRTKPERIETGGGRVTVTSFVDLASLRLDSEWQIEGGTRFDKAAPAGTQAPGQSTGQTQARSPSKGVARPLPAVTVSYTGRIGDMSRIEQRISSEVLERELVVRRMERELEDLERSRLKQRTGEAAPAERAPTRAPVQSPDPAATGLAKTALPVPVPIPVPATSSASGIRP